MKDSFGAEMVQIIKATVVAGSEPFLYESLVIAVALTSVIVNAEAVAESAPVCTLDHTPCNEL